MADYPRFSRFQSFWSKDMNYKDFAGSYLANYLIQSHEELLVQTHEELEMARSPMELLGFIFTQLATGNAPGPDEEAGEPEYQLGADYKNVYQFSINGKSLYLFDLFTENLDRWAFSNSSDSKHIARLRAHVYEMIEDHDIEYDTQVAFEIQSLDNASFMIEASLSIMDSPLWSEKIYLTCD